MSKFLRLASGLVALLIAASAAAADPAKLLRISFPVAETGFDPVRVSDLYSNIVNEAIFERLLTYDYLARPAKLVPMTAESMPEVSESGRTYIVHLKRRHLLRTRSGIQGAAARADCGRLRLFVQAPYRPGEPLAVWVHAARARSSGSTSRPKRRRSPASSTTMRRSPVSSRSTSTRCASGSPAPITSFPTRSPTYPFCAVAREVVEAYGETTSRRIPWAPARTC